MAHSKEVRIKKPDSVGGKVLRFFSSMKLALILMLVLVGLSLVGTFLNSGSG